MVLTLLTPALKASMLLSDTQIGLLQGPAFALCYAFAGLPIGRLVDRKNRRIILIVGVVAWSLATLCCGLASDYTHLFLARMGLGISESCIAPSAFSLVADYMAPKSRGKAIGVLTGATAVGSAGSSILGGLLLKALGGAMTVTLPVLGQIASWRLVFIIFALPGVLVTMLVATIREPARRGLAAIGERPRFLPYLKRNAAVYGQIYAASSANQLFIYAFLFWGPLVFVRKYHMSPADVGIMSGSMLLVGGLVGGLAGGILSDAFLKRFPGQGRILLLCALIPIQIACVALFSFGGTLLLAIVAFAGIKVMSPFVWGPIYVLLQDLSPNQMRGQVMALQGLLTSLIGTSLGPMSVAFVTDRVFHNEAMVGVSLLMVGFPALVASLLLAILAMRSHRRLGMRG
jgi:MFS family permease